MSDTSANTVTSAGQQGDNANTGGNNVNSQPATTNTGGNEGGSNQFQSKTPESVPYARFKEVNDKYKSDLAKLSEFETAEKQRSETEAIAKGEHQKIIDSLKPQAERAEKLEGTLKKMLESELKNIPDDKKALIPDSLPVEAKLEYIALNRALIMGKSTATVGQGSNPGINQSPQGKTFTVSQIQDSAFYTANEAEIKKAYSEGRIVEG